MMISDRILGLVAILAALGYAFGAAQIETSFLSDPVGSKTFPYIIAAIGGVCGLMMFLRPDPDPDWPGLRGWASLVLALAVLIGYAYSLKPLGFILPTAIAAGVLSFQIRPKAAPAALTGAGLAIGLFVVFKYALGLSLAAGPKGFMG